MTARDALKAEVNQLVQTRKQLIELAESLESFVDFSREYQIWYTKSLKLIKTLAPERLDEFCSYYNPDPKRKFVDFSTYVIQDYLRGIQASKRGNGEFCGTSIVPSVCWFSTNQILSNPCNPD